MSDRADWRIEARGIEPWPGAMFLDGEGKSHLCTGTTPSSDYMPEARVWWERGDEPAEECCPDLDHGPTLAWFDRLLAARLGAPAEAVAEGVLIVFDIGWWCFAGQFRRESRGQEGGYRWESLLSDAGDTTCPITARVRAWKSVPG